MTTNPEVLRIAREHLNEMLVGFEIASDAEAAKRRFDKDANALRVVLDHLRQSEKDNSDAD